MEIIRLHETSNLNERTHPHFPLDKKEVDPAELAKNPNHIKDIMKITGYRKIHIGDEINTAYGDFRILDIWYDDENCEYISKCIWNIYNNNGTVHDSTLCLMPFSALEDYICFTEGSRKKLIYERMCS